MAKILLLLTIFVHLLGAEVSDDNGSDFGDDDWIFFHEFVNSIDLFQSNLSQQIYTFSYALDNTLHRFYVDENSNQTLLEQSSWYDEFFRDEIYYDSYTKSYARVSGGYEFNYLGEPVIIQDATIRLSLPKIENQLQFFVGSDTNTRESVQNQTESDVGIRYFLPTIIESFKVNASLGFAGFSYPYIKAYVRYPYEYKDLYIRVVQQVRYSHQDGYSEQTNLYIDKEIWHKKIFRFFLQRSSKYSANGMFYLSEISLRETLRNGVGLRVIAGVYGKTKSQKEGIYSYMLKLTWKKNIFREYLFYQLEPTVEFDRVYDFQANYLLKLYFELYFGKI